MHTWLASGLMSRVIRSNSTSSREKRAYWRPGRKTAALAAVIAILAFAFPMAIAQQGQPAHTTQVAAAVTAPIATAVQDQSSSAPAESGGEASLRLPDMNGVTFLNGISGYKLLEIGLVFCFLGGLFGLSIYMQLKNAPVHRSMREISELIYETCKTYLVTQGKFILLLEAFIAVVIVLYFGVLEHYPAGSVIIILVFSLIGIAGSYGVAWFGIRVNTFANS